jgi:glycosyltransferase involved in cell wall biosynthesis
MRFFINNCNPTGGPGIFGGRLKKQLEKNGHTFCNPYHLSLAALPPLDKNISIIQGDRIAECHLNVLRLDGLYFDSESSNNDQMNSGIFKSFDQADHIVYQSQFSKDMYHSFYGRKDPSQESIIHNGLDQEEFLSNVKPVKLSDPVFSKYGKICVASASWRRHKRLEETIEAFKDPKLKNVLLIALGGMSYIKDKSSIPDNVLLTPLLKPEQTASIYCMADAMIHLAWLDWCPNTVVEGLSCGAPVLCSHNGGTKELVKDNGVVVQLEEDYEIGVRVPLYNPPKVDTNIIVDGILEVLEKPTIFDRLDLDIKNTAEYYEGI